MRAPSNCGLRTSRCPGEPCRHALPSTSPKRPDAAATKPSHPESPSFIQSRTLLHIQNHSAVRTRLRRRHAVVQIHPAAGVVPRPFIMPAWSLCCLQIRLSALQDGELLTVMLCPVKGAILFHHVPSTAGTCAPSTRRDLVQPSAHKFALNRNNAKINLQACAKSLKLRVPSYSCIASGAA